MRASVARRWRSSPTLRVLRKADEDETPLAGLALLEQLVQRTRMSGVDVRLRVERTPQRLAPGLDVTAYRVLQEALTNVLKHAPAARARVDVTYGEKEARAVGRGWRSDSTAYGTTDVR